MVGNNTSYDGLIELERPTHGRLGRRICRGIFSTVTTNVNLDKRRN